MGILSRFSDILSANINALLDKAEDPAKMIDQYLRNAMDDLAQVKQETAAVMAEESRCKRLVDAAQAEVDKYAGLAKKALQSGSEDDARVFIAEKQKAEAHLASIQPTYEAAKANADKMRQMHDKLQSDIEQLRARRNNIKATVAVAKTQERVNKVSDTMDHSGRSVAAFERMEEKANRMLDEANAKASLNEKPVSEAEKLAEKYSGASNASVDDELARMKAELGV